MSAIAKALELAAQGYPVFPVAVSKRPTCPCGFKDAALEPREIRRLWRYHPAPLIGVPTGEPSGLFVLDIDSPKHVEAAEWFERYAPYLPETRQQTTRSGGTHLFFNHHQGLRNSAGRIARGIDTRADGGYIIAWQMQAWLNKQVMLAFTHMMLMAEVMGYDTAPMEGFEQDKVHEVLRLPLSYWVVALLAIGHAKGPDKFYGGRFDMGHTVFGEEFGKALK